MLKSFDVSVAMDTNVYTVIYSGTLQTFGAKSLTLQRPDFASTCGFEIAQTGGAVARVLQYHLKFFMIKYFKRMWPDLFASLVSLYL